MKKYNSLFVALCIIISSIGCNKLGCRKRMDDVKLNPIFQNFQPEEQLFELFPKKSSEIVGNRCTRLIIPPEAFDLEYDLLLDEEKVTVKLTEYLDTLDFASSGINQIYINDEGNEELFESAGMVRVRAEFNRKPLKLKKGRLIKIQFPSLARGDKFNLYKLSDGGIWEYQGYNQESYAIDGNMMLECVRLYDIQELGYWNFAYPRKDSSLIRGTVRLDNENDPNQVFVIGLNTKGYWQNWVNKEKFVASFYQRTRVRVVVVSPDGRIGISKKFNTGDRYGNKKYPEGPHNYVMDIGEIEFKNVSSSILNDKLEFIMYLGIEL